MPRRGSLLYVARKVQSGSSRVQFGRRIAFAAVAICAAASLTSFAADRTISADYALTADETVDGVLTVDSGATVDLAGHNLTVKGLSGGGTIAGRGTLYVDTAGGTVANSTVSLTGGLKLTVGGGGTFTASKASQSYTGGTEAAANTTISLGTVTHPLGNGNASQTVTLGAGAKLKYNNLQDASTCCYSFILHQGSVVDAGSNGGRWVRHFKDITLYGDATFKAQDKICVGTNTGSVPCLVTLNGHTLYLNLNGDHNMRGFKTVGEGKVVFQAGGASFYSTTALPVDFSSATLGFEGTGWFFHGNNGITVGNLYFSSSTKIWRSQGAQESYVLGTYIAGDFRAPFTMKSGATLDLSEMTGTWNAHGLTIDAANTDRSGTGRVTFLAANAAYTVDVGTRAIAKDDVLVQFESGYVPTDSVVFNLAATGAAQTPEERHLGVVAKDSGGGYYNLVVKDTLTPYARWVIDNDNPANSGWKFYNPTDDTENTDWRDGVTDDVEVRIFSYAEHQAIVAAGVSPFRYSLYGTIQIPGDAAEWNLTTCFDGMAEGASIDLNGQKLYLDRVNFDGTITDTSADTDHPGELHVTVASGTIANTLVTLTGNLKLVKEGAGTFTASKANQSYTGGTEVQSGTLLLGTATHPLGNGNASQAVTVRENATFNFNDKRNTSTCAYNFILYGGAKVNSTVPSGRNNQRLFGTITLEGDATFTLGGTANFGGVNEATRSRLVLNGHTLSLEQGGDGQWGFVNTVDDGVVQFTSGSSGIWLGSIDFSSATFGTAGTGFINIGSYGFTCGTFQWKSSTKKWTGNTGGSVPIPKVMRRYIAGSFSPPLQMANGSTLDLSEVSGTWDDKTGSAWSDLSGYQNQVSTRGLVSFASGATINIDVGERQVAAGDRLVQFASEPSGITFVPSQSMVAANLTVFVKQIDGTWYLCVKSTEIPYARWHIDATTPANSGWKFYNAVTGAERTDWEDGITGDVEVRFSSYAEWTAIQAQNVTPSRYVLDGAVVLDGLSSIWNLNGISIASGTTLDLNGYSVTLQSLEGFASVTDSSLDAPGELYVNTTGGNIANATTSFSGNMKLVIEGGHTFTASKANQTYTGGTEVAANTTLALGTVTHPLGNGNATQTVTLGAGAKFVSGAYYNSTTCAYNFIADEGASMTFGTTGDRSTRRFGSIELLGDASITMQGKSAFVGLSAANPSTFKLNGNTLSVTVNGGADSNAKHIKSLDAGTIRFVSVDNNGMQNQDGATDFSSARVEFASGAYVHLGNSGMTVGDFMYAGTKWRTFGGGIKVAGTYEAAAFRPPIQMLGGSTLDLSGITGALSTTGTAPSNTGHNNHTEPGAVTFASGATVSVDLSGRTDLWELAKSANPYVVAWSSQPNATFTLDAETAEHFKIAPDGTGIKLLCRSGFTIFVK